nr:sigma-70 family RNA polymerase sigma factor [Brevundimonas albigilva]
MAEHGAMLRRIASAYEADRERRRELEQDILLAVWRALPKHRGDAPLRHFIARVAHNRAVTHVAREAAEPRRQPLDEAAPSDAPTPHEAAEARDLHDRLADAVRALPLPLRQPALLTLEGFPGRDRRDAGPERQRRLYPPDPRQGRPAQGHEPGGSVMSTPPKTTPTTGPT